MSRLFALLLFLPISSFAQVPKEISLNSKIENVTIFLNGAQVTRTAKASLESGKTVLIFNGISQQIDKNSVQVNGEGKFTIISVVHQLNNKREEGRRAEIAKIESEKKILEDKIKSLKINLLVYKREEEMLVKNQNIGGAASGLKVTDFKEAVEFQRVRMQEALSKQLDIEREIDKVEKDIKKINQQLSEETISKDATTSDILVTVSSQDKIPATTFTLSYFVRDAAWKPTYDVRVEQISEPVNLTYKASVYQFSGEDWKDVQLRLSTANPNQTGTPPVLQTWYWGSINDYSNYYNEQKPASEIITEVSGRVRDKTGVGLAGASVILKGTALGATTDVDGFYRLNIPPNSKLPTLTFAFVGYQPRDERVYSQKLDVVLEDDVKQLQEVVVMGYGMTVNKELSGRLAGVSVRTKSTIPIDVEEKDAPTSQSFDILTPYSIPSNGKVYTIDIKEENLPAVYEYYAVPKIDRDAFLTAHIVDWEKYKFLDGEVNLYFEGTFLGKSILKLPNSDTLDFALGRDKNVLITRTRVKDFTKKQFVGNSKIDQLSYEITIRNTKSKPINLILEDQFPLSNNKEIEVYDKDAKGAELNSEIGKITWKISLEPATEKKVNFSYKVKYPKTGYVDVGN